MSAMTFDPTRQPVAPRDAAAVILIRDGAAGAAEVLLLCRNRRASFMSSAWVFPGGAADPPDRDLRETAARELFEEAGVLLLAGGAAPADAARWRAEIAGGRAVLAELLATAGLDLGVDRLRYFAHWITPSAESRRFSARFFVAELPAGQTPSFDDSETVGELWVTPEQALVRSAELRLPPPQIRTMLELRDAAARGAAAVLALAEQRARHPQPVLPRFAVIPDAPGGFALLLPWDPHYHSAGTGEAIDVPAGHPIGGGPSRFVLVDGAWRHVSAPA
jgi:8-oxo-dGTP pyrophosphatase MutT (NUDIX family)